MELVNPVARPRLKTSPLETETATLRIGGSTYKLIYASKMAIACGRQHAGIFRKISRHIPGFASEPGFILQKQNSAEVEEAVAAKRAKFAPNTMGATAKGTVSQFVPLNIGMAGAIFNPQYVESLKSFIEEEIASGAGQQDDGNFYQERAAEKPACRFPPPAYQKQQKSSIGTLVVGTGFSNYNIVRHMLSDGEFQFEGVGEDDGKPQLLCQITMTDTKAPQNSPPMVRFSAPHTEMMAILENAHFREMIMSRKNLTTRADTPRPEMSSKEVPMAVSGDESD